MNVSNANRERDDVRQQCALVRHKLASTEETLKQHDIELRQSLNGRQTFMLKARQECQEPLKKLRDDNKTLMESLRLSQTSRDGLTD